MLGVRFFRGTDCVINHCLVAAKVIKKLLGSTRETQRCGMDRSNLKLNEVKIRNSIRLESQTGLQVLENLD